MPQELRVLIVEGVPAEADLAVHHLQRGGIRCRHRVADSEPALRSALRAFRPHLILSEFALPGLDGFTALEIAVKCAPDVPFIFLSAALGEDRVAEAFRRGAADCVPKAHPAGLVPAVKRALRNELERRQRRLAEQQVRENEQRLRDIVNTVQDWIWELDASGRYAFSSESVRGVLGLEPADLLGRHFRDYLHEEDRAAFAEALARLDVSQRTAMGMVTRWRHRSGEIRWLEGNLLALIGSDGRVTGFRGTHRDITERRLQQDRIARLTRALQMQSGINAAVVRIRHRDELLREACRLALSVGGYDRALLAVVTPDGKRAVPWFWLDDTGGRPFTSDFVISDGKECDTSFVSHALRTGEIVVCADLEKFEPACAAREALLSAGFRTVVAIPLIVDGSPVGALVLASREADLLRDEELRLLQDIQSNLAFALQYRQKEDAVQFLAYFDTLTGLAKRSLFCERLDKLLRARLDTGGDPAVVAFDLVHLNSVNDSFGRHVGDLLLQHVADRLKRHVEDDSRIGYLGGGTFALVVTQPDASTENVTALLESTVFRDAFCVEGRVIRPSFKSGVARFPVDGEDGNTLVQRAEAALKQAKESGEPYLHYQVSMRSDIAERVALENKLRIALDERQFLLHYQPQVNVATGRIESVEALLRWHDPQEDLIPPERFLPLLESSGMIMAVGDWVLRQAAEDCQRWRQMGLSPVRVAVNVSASQIRKRTFVQDVLAVASRCLQGGFGLDLEITETSLMHDMEGTSRKLRELRAAGVRIAIDDFGTGYSSLGLLSKLPVDLLKIDRSFISGLPADRASLTLVSSIIGLASAFELRAVAEGVETVEQLEVLRRLRCHQSQGFLHSEPLPADRLELLLARNAAEAAPSRHESARSQGEARTHVVPRLPEPVGSRSGA